MRAYGGPRAAVLLSAVGAAGPGLETHGVIVQDEATPAGIPVCLMPTTAVQVYCAKREEPVVRQSRRCSRSGCAQPAAATLTYVYAESTAVVGPLATFSEPHSYDLCEFHATSSGGLKSLGTRRAHVRNASRWRW